MSISLTIITAPVYDLTSYFKLDYKGTRPDFDSFLSGVGVSLPTWSGPIPANSLIMAVYTTSAYSSTRTVGGNTETSTQVGFNLSGILILAMPLE